MTPLVLELLIVLVCAFGLGAALILIAGTEPRFKPAAKELWPLYWSEFLIVSALLVPAVLGDWTFMAVLILFVWRGQYELFRLFDVKPWGVAQIAAMLAGGAIAFAGGYWATGVAVLLALAGGVVVATIAGMLFEKAEMRHLTAASVLSLIFPALFAACVLALRTREDGLAWIVVIYAIVEINDAMALVAGKLFGKRRVLPRLSPRKTVAGLVAGLLTGFLVGLLLTRFMLGLAFADSWRVVAIVLAAGVAGDLLTSGLKRWRGKKDFSSVLPAHGGVLDIYDSFLIAAPVLFVLRFTLGGEP